MQLDPPSRYFPITRGLYEVAPGLKRLGTDFGNGAMDARVFQIDADFPRFRQSKLACRQDRLDKYLQRSDLSPQAERALVEWFIDRLTAEYPHLFIIDGNGILCRHTSEIISLSEDLQLRNVANSPAGYESAFDALANQVAEDVCLMRLEGSRNWLAAGHVCSPGHWSVMDKIGKPFTAIHDPVPGIDAINQRSAHFVDMMIHQGPFVRFAWGFGTDDRLNHHPQPPAGFDPDQWRGRTFDPQNPSFFLRVERQVIWGLPAVNAAAFVIRVSHIGGEQIRVNPAERNQVISALKSMSAESRRYKGIDSTMQHKTGQVRLPNRQHKTATQNGTGAIIEQQHKTGQVSNTKRDRCDYRTNDRRQSPLRRIVYPARSAFSVLILSPSPPSQRFSSAGWVSRAKQNSKIYQHTPCEAPPKSLNSVAYPPPLTTSQPTYDAAMEGSGISLMDVRGKRSTFDFQRSTFKARKSIFARDGRGSCTRVSGSSRVSARCKFTRMTTSHRDPYTRGL